MQKYFKLKLKSKLNFLILIIFMSGYLYAGNTNISESGAQFLRLNVGAEANAMAGAYTAVSADATSIYWNPAGLGYLKNREFLFIHSTWFDVVDCGFMSFVVPVSKNSGLGLAMQYVNYGELDYTDKDGNSDGKFSPADNIFSLSYGYNFKIFSLGLTAKTINSIITHNASTYAFDAGLDCDILRSLRLGIVMRNMGDKGLKYKTYEDSLPTSLSVGLRWNLNKNILMSFESEQSKDEDLILATGLEYKTQIKKDLKTALRCGYTDKTKDIDKILGFSCGFGIDYKNYKINYSYTPSGEFGNSQVLSLGIEC